MLNQRFDTSFTPSAKLFWQWSRKRRLEQNSAAGAGNQVHRRVKLA
jgi:hypothetical protein